MRDPQKGCPWDKEQTFKTIVPHTLEEAYEVADAIERDDLVALRDELGDLLFQVVFYAQLAKEQQLFDFNDVVASISDKLERRHPHVFADVVIADAEAQTIHWEQLKAQERKASARSAEPSVLDGIAQTLPALNLAQKLQKRAAQVGFDWPNHDGVLDKVKEELAELVADWDDDQKQQDELGDVLFTCVNLARHARIDAETALRYANRKFAQRFRAMEQQLRRDGVAIEVASAAQKEAAWQKIKKQQAG